MIAVMLSTVGCSGSENTPSGGATTADGALSPYAETLTLTRSGYRNSMTTYIDGESENDNFITKFYLDKLNVRFEDKWSADNDNYYTRLELAIASGDIPDVMMVNKSQLGHLVKLGYAADMTDVYNKYAGELLKKNLEYEDRAAFKAAEVDGRIYALPLTCAYESDAALMWIRSDWLKKTGLNAPTDAESFIDFLRALKESGLAGHSHSGLDAAGPGSVCFDALAEMWGAYYDIWIPDKNGNGLVYSSFEPEMRNALIQIQKMYSEGLIDRNFAINGTPITDRILRGDVGVVFGQFFYPHLLKYSLMNDKDADWEAYPIPAGPDGKVLPKKSVFVDSYAVVSSSCKNPEALVKCMNLWSEIWLDGGKYRSWYSDKITGEYKSITGCGNYAVPYFFEGVENCMNIGKDIRSVFSEDAPEKAIENYPYAKITYSYIDNDDPQSFIKGEGWALKKVYMSGERVFSDNYGEYMTNRYQGMMSGKNSYTEARWRTRTVETFLNIIMGDPIEEFDKLKKEWTENSGRQLIDEVNIWYAEDKSAEGKTS